MLRTRKVLFWGSDCNCIFIVIVGIYDLKFACYFLLVQLCIVLLWIGEFKLKQVLRWGKHILLLVVYNECTKPQFMKPWNLLQPLILGRSDLLAVHWLFPYEHTRIQRIAMMSPVIVQSSFESIQQWSRHLVDCSTRKEKNANLAWGRQCLFINW